MTSFSSESVIENTIKSHEERMLRIGLAVRELNHIMDSLKADAETMGYKWDAAHYRFIPIDKPQEVTKKISG